MGLGDPAPSPVAFRVPVTLADVTPTWIAEVLGVQVEAITVEQIAAGEGFMGQLARVSVTTSDPAPASVIVKLPTGDPGGRMIGDMMRVWEREHAFYRDVAPAMRTRVPKVLFNSLDPVCLVLEDLAPAMPGDHVAGASDEQAERAIDAIAAHHAQWFEHPDLAGFEWLPGLDDPSVHTLGAMFEVGWPTFLERYADELPARTLRWCEVFVPQLTTWIERHFDDPVTLIHGDFRLDNLFFAEDGSVALVDWQLAMRAPGQTDLVYFCANNLTVESRRRLDRALVERYVDALRRHGVDTPAITVESVWRGYLEGLIFYASSFGASLLTIDPANERGAALFDQLVRRTFTAVDDHAAGETIGLT